MTHGRTTPGERLKVLQEHYDFATWRDADARGPALLVWQFLPMEPGLPGWQSVSVRRLAIAEWPPATRSAWRPEQEDEDVLLTLDTYECADAAAAREWLLHLLGSVQSDLFSRIEAGAPGEVAFGVPDGAAVAYARANLVCFLRNGGRTVRPLTEAAAALDRWLTDRPKPGGRLAPDVSRAQADLTGADDEGGATLYVEAQEPAERPVWFKFHAARGVLSIRNGLPHYRPDSRGAAATVTVYAVGPAGTASRSIEITPRRRKA